ncbi:MAG: dihydrolipoyllysine-residue succinyltransferase [Deltaproteobacteria bacterium]|nr:dihydrolipoyllysine-residue succinyltransferase [Deltaproteobacteria bacterium]
MEIKIPEVGESVYEVTIARWHKQEGEQVSKDDLLCELETDKITLELHAEAAGVLHVKYQEGDVAKIGDVLAEIDEQTAPAAKKEAPPKTPEPESKPEAPSPVAGTKTRKEEPPPAPQEKKKTMGPAPKSVAAPPSESTSGTTRKPMSPIRKRIAERLVAARQETAMLTTFNEVDMSEVKKLREKYRDRFKERYGVSLGFMSFFVKASIEALEEFPQVNAFIDGDDIVYHDFINIGIAVGSEKGLVVPVIKDAAKLHFSEIEKNIADFVEKIKSNQLALADLEGGTFTISNGGVYGSMLSTPILNPPQSAVLGMHAIQDRPMVRDGEIVIRPIMYLALSYDHRIIDGREAVGFLKKIKAHIEEPEQMLLDL